jgi:hypothetical protein
MQEMPVDGADAGTWQCQSVQQQAHMRAEGETSHSGSELGQDDPETKWVAQARVKKSK